MGIDKLRGSGSLTRALLLVALGVGVGAGGSRLACPGQQGNEAVDASVPSAPADTTPQVQAPTAASDAPEPPKEPTIVAESGTRGAKGNNTALLYDDGSIVVRDGVNKQAWKLDSAADADDPALKLSEGAREALNFVLSATRAIGSAPTEGE